MKLSKLSSELQVAQIKFLGDHTRTATEDLPLVLMAIFSARNDPFEVLDHHPETRLAPCQKLAHGSIAGFEARSPHQKLVALGFATSDLEVQARSGWGSVISIFVDYCSVRLRAQVG